VHETPLARRAPVAADASLSPDALVEMFKGQSPAETAKWLEKQMAADAATPAPKPVRNFGQNSVPLYKGVAFPG
jgi:hypothetical protein